jgi:hypothetical protein
MDNYGTRSIIVQLLSQPQLASQLTGRLLGIEDDDIQALLNQTTEKAPRPLDHRSGLFELT